ncbi:MAG: InlB B-repeat-containing protein, partial [Ruminococcus sp.]|nr:InlB B-repeat-containing protein [Ruminococcus sp.]
MKKKLVRRTVSAVLSLLIAVSCIFMAVVPASAATYRNGAQSGPSTSYKNGKYYRHYLQVPITGDNRTDLLAIALSQLGYQEGASNGAFSGEVSGGQNYVEFSYNMGDLGLGYGGSDYPWCASFVSWCLYQSHCTDQATYKDLGRNHVGDYTYIWKEISCSQWVRQLKGAGYYKYSAYEGGSYTPKYGDLVYFQNSKGVAHIGICLYTSGGRIYTVEGNTSDSSGLEANGGGVYFKNYSLSTSYINGYGVLPYKSNSAVPKIDYSGANPTPGLYVSNAAKYIYSSETATSYSYVIPRFSMFEITKIGTNGTRLYGTFTTTTGATVTGWVNNNSDRIIQLSSSEETASPEELAREALEKTVASAMSIRHYNYTEAKILEIRAAYNSAVSVLANTSATEAELTSADTTLKALLAQTGTNTIGINNQGIYINGRNSVIKAGDCFMYSPTWNDGLITVDNANIRYTVNVVVKWDTYLQCNVVKSVSVGTGSSTPDIQLGEGEWLIAAHNWETGVAESDNPVEYSGTNYNILTNLQVGSRVYVSGCTALNAGTDVEPAAFIKFGAPDSTKMTAKNEKADKGDFVLFTPAFNSGLLTHSNANIHKTINVIAQWDAQKSAWIVTDKYHGNGMEDETSNIEIVDGQVVIAGYAWEAGVTDGTAVLGSTGNWNKLNTAEVGQQVIFSGITPTYGSDYLSVSANIDFVDYTGDSGEEEDTTTSGPVNLALGKSYEAIEQGTTHIANLTDGVYPSELWPSGNWFGFNKEGNTTDGVGTVTIDLGARYNLESFRAHIYSRDDSSSIGPPAYVNVYTSNNGTDFVSVGSLALDATQTEGYWASLENAESMGRYVRFEAGACEEGHYWVFLNELEVYGTSLTGAENIALNTTQTVTSAGESYNTSLVDGVADTELASDKWFGFLNDADSTDCNTTDGVGTAIIDLGARFSITDIRAHFFAGENTVSAGAPASVTVSVSIDGTTYAKAGTMTLEEGATAPYWATMTQCDAVGRYIKFEVECADTWTLINEVEAYGVSHVQTSDNNIALEKAYTSPAYSDSPYTASLTDGIASNIFQYGLNNSSWFAFKNTGDAETGNTTNGNGIVTIDLGGQAEITGTAVHLFAGDNDAGAVQPVYINVYISDDGTVFDYIKTIDADKTKTEAYWAQYTLDTPVYARYIKYAFSVGSDRLVLLNEIKVTGTMLSTSESDEPGSMSSVTLAGSFNGWNATPNMQRVDSTTVSLSMSFSAGTYEFKILDGSVWYGNNGIIDNSTDHTSETGWEMTEDAGNCVLNATGGMYNFLYNTQTRMLRVLHTPDTYYIRGDFNEWGTWDVLTENEDGTFSKTLTLAAGTYEFKAANEDYSKQWPEFNDSLTLSRTTDVTFTLDIFANTLTYTQEVNDFIVTFVGFDGNVLSTQEVRRGGSATAPEAPARDGYNFSGWNRRFDNVSEDIKVIAMYQKTHGTFKVDITGGTGFTISVNEGTARPQGSTYVNSKMPIGALVTVTAMSLTDEEFLGWINPANGQVLSLDYSYTFYSTGNDYIKAMYQTHIEGVNMVIFKNDKAAGGNGQILDAQYYAYGDEVSVPLDPSQTGFDFAGWNMTDSDIQTKLQAGEDATVLATWERQIVPVEVTVINGTGSGEYNANSAVTVVANEPAEGMKFAYWTDAAGNIKSYEESYKFYPSADTALTAVFVAEDAEIEYQILVNVDTIDTTSIADKNVTYFSWYVPETELGITFVDA